MVLKTLEERNILTLVWASRGCDRNETKHNPSLRRHNRASPNSTTVKKDCLSILTVKQETPMNLNYRRESRTDTE